MHKTNISRLVMDVLKPHNPPLHILSMELVQLVNSGIEGVNITLEEYDRMTQTIKIAIQGKNLDYDIISQKLEELSCSIRSVDQVICGLIVEYIETPQD
ncbi:MAG: hypothetical protein RBG13Loki_1759 [Promethearchaeota archaeon CR_4]|nr:MAG: hypothetical protein RBG13Loki_1759 [Candidatus Lokiarchaeota archaeon CR_4]